jgi:hypothetical protein
MSAKPQTKFVFDTAKRQYETASGHVVSPAQVADLLQTSIKDSQTRVRALTTQFKEGALSLPEWQIAMRDEVKLIHTLAGVSARGGWAEMSQSDWGRIGQMTRFHYERLNKWGLQIEQGLRVNVGRADLYAKAANTTFWNFFAQMQGMAGAVKAVRVINAKESCAGCLAIAGVEMTIEVLLEKHPIGSKECQVNCRCSIEIVG